MFRQTNVTRELGLVTDASIHHADDIVKQVVELSSQLEDIERIKKILNKLEQNLYYYEKVASSLLKRRKRTRNRMKST